MTLKIEIKMDNAAFEENGQGTEVARILRDVAKHAEQSGEFAVVGAERRLMDFNGNTVGKAKVVA